MEKPLLIKGARVIDPAQNIDRIGDLLIQDGLISGSAETIDQASLGPDVYTINAHDQVICPGFIDIHCHLREPGHEEKETIATGTLAAARGGFTTVCCMPNTDPAIDNSSVVEFIVRQARLAGYARVYPIGCVTKGRAGHQLADLIEMAKAGVVGFSDDGSPVGNADIMRAALTYSQDLDTPVINHCEDLSLTLGGVMHEGWVSTRLGLPGCPAAAEEIMMARDISLAELTNGRLHLAHVTTAGGVELVRRAKERGLNVTAEVTPHHLTMTHEWAMGFYGNDKARNGPLTTSAYDARTKVNPPLRTRQDVESLIDGLNRGIIDTIATDHAPHALTDKQVTFEEAAVGFSLLETALGSLLGLVHQGHIDLPTMVHRLTVAPSQVMGGRFSKLASLRPGTPADVVLFDPKKEWTVDTNYFASKGTNTPIDGAELKGQVSLTIMGGAVIYDGMGNGKGGQ